MTFRQFVFGPPRWRPRPALPVVTALLSIVGIFLGGKLAALLIAYALYGDAAAEVLRSGDAGLVAMMIWLLTAQIAMIGLSIVVAQSAYPNALELLRLQAPAGGIWDYVWAALVFAAVVALVNSIHYLVQPHNLLGDLELYMKLVRSDALAVAAAAVVAGAPLSEELMFRGLLLPALAVTRLGYAGATAVSVAVWAAMHLGYSIAGLVEVGIFGLVLSWLLWRTGSLRVPLFCHALYNGLLLAAVWLWAPGR
jgi:membrane protease YdiL (CAAX protease family)